MASRIFRVDLAEGARDFKPIATEPGLAMLDRQNVNYGLISKWLGELAAEPDWESADVVSFYVRQPEHGRLADIRCGPASVRDLQGPLSADLEAIGQRLRKVKAESSTEQLLHSVLTRQYKHITEDLAARGADCCFIKYRRPGEPWRLVWCWGYQRTDLEPAKACVCTNDQCGHLFVNRKGTKARCPICTTVPRRQAQGRHFTLGPRTLAVLLLAVLLLAWFGRPRLVVTPEQWSGPRGSRVAFEVRDRRWFFFDENVSDRVVAQSHDTRYFEFIHGAGATGRAKRAGPTAATFYYGNLQMVVSIEVKPPQTPKTLRLQPPNIDLAIGATTRIQVFGQYDPDDQMEEDVDLTDVVQLSVADPGVAVAERDRVYGKAAGKTTLTAKYIGTDESGTDESGKVQTTAKVAVREAAYKSLAVDLSPDPVSRGQIARVSVVATDEQGQQHELTGSPKLKLDIDPQKAGELQDNKYFVAQQSGEATLTAMLDKLDASITFRIEERPRLSEKIFEVKPDGELTLFKGGYIDVTVVSGGQGQLSAKSSDDEVVEVDGTRLLAKNEGEATVTFQQDGLTDVVRVKVVPAAAIQSIRIQPNLINVYVGESRSLDVVGVTPDGKTVDLAPDQLVWLKQPREKYAVLMQDPLRLVGRKRTKASEELVVQYAGSLKASARVDVFRGFHAPDIWVPHPPLVFRGLPLDPGPLLGGGSVTYLPGKGLVIWDLPWILRDSGIPNETTIVTHNGVDLAGMTVDELKQYFRNNPILNGDEITVVDADGTRIKRRLIQRGICAVVFQEVQIQSVDPRDVTSADFVAEVHLQVREAAEYRIVDNGGHPISDWELHPAHARPMFRTQPIDRIGFGEEYFWAVERRLETGGKVERFPFSFSLESLSDNDPDVRARAASNLLDQNGEPEVIVQRMIELMANEQTLYEAILVLRELGLDASPAVPALAKALSHEDEEIRLMAAEALRAIGPQAKGAVPELLKALDDKELIVRMPAVLALGSIGLEAHTAAAKIRSLQKSDDKLLNVCALWALEKIEPDEGRLKTKTMPALINYMRDEDPEVRTAAALAVLQLQPEADVVTDPALRADVFLTLGQIGPAAQGAIASAIEALRDSDKKVQSSALFALGKIGPQAADAVDEIRALLDRDDDPFIKMFCAWALARIAPDNPRDCQRAIPVLIEALGHEQSFVRIEAAATLGMIGPEAKAAIQALEKLNKDPDSDREVREAAAAAIRQIGP